MRDPNAPLDIATTFDSALLQKLARDASERAASVTTFEALGAIVLAYIALEAFLNEVAQLAATLVTKGVRLDEGGQNDRLPTLALVMDVAVEKQAQTSYRYDLAWQVLSGAKPDTGSGRRQELTALAALRNDIVHLKAEQYAIVTRRDEAAEAEFKKEYPHGTFLGRTVGLHKHPKYFRSLETRGLLSDGDEEASWLQRVCNPRLARWACDLVEHLARDLVGLAPAGSTFRRRLESYSLGGCITRRADPARFGL